MHITASGLRPLALISVVALLGITAFAQSQPLANSKPSAAVQNSHPPTAFLSIDASRDGGLVPNFSANFPIERDWVPQQTLSEALHCEPGAKWHAVDDEDSDEYTVDSRCSLNVKRNLLNTEGEIDLSSLESVLKAKDVSELSVTFSVESSGFLECNPAPRRKDVSGTDFCVYSLPLSSSSPGVFRFSYGYRTAGLIEGLALLLVVLFLPVLLTLWLRHEAVHAPAESREAVWFSYLRFRNWGMLGGFLLWWTAIDLLLVNHLVSYVFGDTLQDSQLLSTLLPWIGLWIPPILVYVLCSALSAPIQQARGSEHTQREIVRQAMWAGANLVVPVFFVVLAIAFLSYSARMAALCFLAMLVSLFIARLGLARSVGMDPQALTTGELRDRAFTLASKARVDLNQVYVLPMQRMRMANAFAHSKQNVLLTDYLLKNLSKPEVDAVVAHEITHLQKKHSQLRGILFIVGIAIFSWGSISLDSYLPERFPTGPVFLLPVLLVLYFVSRRNEFTADAGSAKLTGDPESMMTSLIKISRLNKLPIHWNRLNESGMTHPSTTRRLLAIAKSAGIAPERVRQLLAETLGSPAETYPLPATVAPRGKVFSTRYKSNVQNFHAWLSLLVFALPPAAFAVAIVTLQLNGRRMWAGYIVGFLSSLAVSLVIQNRVAMHGQKRLAAQLRRKAADEGLPQEIHEGAFVGLGPDAAPRIYEHNWNWDVGLLAVETDRVIYWGEEAQFSLQRAQILRIGLGPGPSNWFRTPSVYISWKANDGSEKTFNLRPAQADSLTQMGRMTRAFAKDLQNWFVGGTTTPDSIFPVRGISNDAFFSEPAFGQVSNRSIRSLLTRRVLFRSYMWVGLVATAIGVISGLHFVTSADSFLPGQNTPPLAGWYVLGSAWGLNTIQLLPSLLRRESKSRKVVSKADDTIASRDASPIG